MQTSLATIGQIVKKMCDLQGLDAQALLGEQGITLDAIRDPNARIPARTWDALARRAATQIGDPAFGLYAAALLASVQSRCIGVRLALQLLAANRTGAGGALLAPARRENRRTSRRHPCRHEDCVRERTHRPGSRPHRCRLRHVAPGQHVPDELRRRAAAGGGDAQARPSPTVGRSIGITTAVPSSSPPEKTASR